MKWQPIETASKDGTRILVINGAEGDYNTEPFDVGVAHAFYIRGELHWSASVCGPEGMRFNPTHWMPLPEPPKELTT